MVLGPECTAFYTFLIYFGGEGREVYLQMHLMQRLVIGLRNSGGPTICRPGAVAPGLIQKGLKVVPCPIPVK